MRKPASQTILRPANAAVAAAIVVAIGAEPTQAACNLAPLAPGDHTFTITWDGLDRTYDVHVPASVDGCKPVPLVLDFHGFTSTKEAQAAISGFRAKADAEGFVVVHPQGYMSSWNAGDFCCGEARANDLDDVGLMTAIAAEVGTFTNIDSSRMYVTGLSNGGAMSHRVACEAALVFAAAAPVAYPIDRNPVDQCLPARPVAVSHYHGYDDVVVPYYGGIFSMPVLDSFAYWGSVTGCTGMPTLTFDDGNRSTCETYETCADAVEINLCSLVGEHVLYTNLALDIADHAWAFLRRFTAPRPDRDGDGVPDADDNCPDVGNADQADSDCNCIGDACEAMSPVNLLRNDETTALDRQSPPYASIFVGTGANSLDPLGPSASPQAGEGPDPTANGSPDGDDLYLERVASPEADPDGLTLGDLGRPLVFYQLEGAAVQLKLTRLGQDIVASW